MAEKSYSISRSYVDTYNGFDIVKEVIAHYFYSSISRRFEKDLITKRDVIYRICKEGDSKKPSKFVVFSDNETIKEARELIDKIVNHEKGYIYVTEDEYKRNVSDKDKKNQHCLSYKEIVKFIADYKKGDEKTRFFILERLENCNFHGYYSLLIEEKYQELEELAADELKFYSDFSLVVTTKRKPLNTTPKMIEEFNKAIREVVSKFFKGEIESVETINRREVSVKHSI